MFYIHENFSDFSDVSDVLPSYHEFNDNTFLNAYTVKMHCSIDLNKDVSLIYDVNGILCIFKAYLDMVECQRNSVTIFEFLFLSLWNI